MTSSEASILHDSNGAADRIAKEEKEDDDDENIRDLEALLGVSQGAGEREDDDHQQTMSASSVLRSSAPAPSSNDKKEGDSSSATLASDRDGSIGATEAKSTQLKMEAFEIEIDEAADGHSSEKENIPMIASVPSEDTLDGEFDDLESLLGSRRTKRKNESKKQSESSLPQQQSDDWEEEDGSAMVPPPLWCLSCCCPGEKEIVLGNIRVPSPKLYAWTNGWGVVGPHWVGPPCVVGLIFFATFYFGYECAWQQGRPYSAATCMVLALTSCYHLMNVAFRNPGIIVKGRLTLPDPLPRTWKYCEICDYYQPPRAVHCPACNVCIAGFDHHCVWMGTCVG